MNDKFFDLSKEKQDRIINAAMKIFCQNGYKRASTDEIVKEAGISKGLLFHYFVSKNGLFSFLCEYSIRFYVMEVGGCVSNKETNYFSILKKIEYGKMQISKTYPYLCGFLDRLLIENDKDVYECVKKFGGQYEEFQETRMAQTRKMKWAKDIDDEKMKNIVQFTMEGIYNEFLRQGCENPDIFYGTQIEYLDMLEKMSERKQ